MSKPIDQLSTDDLRNHPIWEYATDEEDEHDETWVRPLEMRAVPVDDESDVVHVACDLVLATGRELTGFVSLWNGELHDEAPVVVGASGQYWPLDGRPHRRNRVAFEDFFGMPYDGLFPVRWRLRAFVASERELRSGSYPGSTRAD